MAPGPVSILLTAVSDPLVFEQQVSTTRRWKIVIKYVRPLVAALAVVVSVAQPSVAAAQNRVVLLGAPVGTTNEANPEVHVSAPNAVSYKYSLNGAPYSGELPIQTPITFSAGVLIGNSAFRAGSSDLYQFINQRTDQFYTGPGIDRITLDNVESQLQITYLLNKIRSAVRTENVLNLSGPGVASLDVTLREKTPSGSRYELSSFGITGGTLSVATSADSTRTFRLALARNATSITLTPATNNIQTTIAVNGQPVASEKSLMLYPNDGSSISLQTTGPDGSRANYKIDISYDDMLAQTDYRSHYLRSFNPSSDYVSIKNGGPDVVAYGMTFNNTLGQTRQGIIDEIVAMKAQYPDEPIQHRVWRFIRDNRYHYLPLTGATWFSSVALFFNSAGFGFCDDSAALFYQLMMQMGYPARVWGLSGHVVPEVFVNGRWEMWDPDLEVIYQNGQGQVAGVEELAINPALITNPLNPILALSASPYGQVVADIYSSRSDNFVYPPDPMADSPVIMEIPPGGTFEFPDLYETPLDAIELTKVPSYTNARLVVPAGFSGPVSMPLIIHSIGWSNHPHLSVVTKDGGGNWDSVPTTASWVVDVVPPGTTASQASGFYNVDEPVTLTANEPATIYYSTTGSTATGGFSEYTAPVRMLPSGFVQFFAVDQIGNREQVRAYGPSVQQVSLEMSSLAAETVTFTARAAGGVGLYEFNFRMYDPRTGWSTVQPYSESDHWVWNRAGAVAGRYTVEVMARNRGTTEQVVTWAVLAFDVGQTGAPLLLTNPGDQVNGDRWSYAQAVGSDGPVSYWRLDRLVGSSVVDAVGINGGTGFGGVTPGQPGALADGSAAMLFNGSTAYVGVANSAALQLAGDLTLELWLKVSLGARQTLISKGYLNEFELTLETDGTLNLYQGNGTAYSNAWSAAGAVSANRWHHVVVTREATSKTVRFYVDGVARGGGVSATMPAAGSRQVSIARSGSGTQYVNGYLEEVAVYATALSPQQIARHYAMRTANATGTPVELQLMASGPDGHALMYSAAGLPPGLTISATTGLISGTLTSASAGTYHVTVMVSDGSASQIQSFNWTVTQAQSTPTLSFRGDATNPEIDVIAPGKALYRYSINGAPYSPEFAITKPITLTGDIGLAGRQFTAGTAPLADFLTLKAIDDSFTEFFDRVDLDHVKSQVQVTYMVNKMRTAVGPDNVVNLRGAGVADLNVSMHEKVPAGPRFELSSIAVAGGELSETSSTAGNRQFVLSLPLATDAVVVTPVANNGQTTIVVNGQSVTSGQAVSIAAPADGSSIIVRASGPDGVVTSYTIAVRHDGGLAAPPYRSFYLRAFTPPSASVSIQNVGTGAVTYGLTFNRKFGLTAQGLVDEIAGMTPEYPEEPTPRKIWRFIRDNRYHFWPLTRARWNQSPALFFSSIGFGFCDDAAALFYHLATAMGYPSRVWNLSSRHAVPEVFINNRWELWDPDLQVYYQNRSGLVAGVEELASDPDLISHPLISVPGALSEAYSAYVTGIYATRTDTHVNAGAGWLPPLNDASMLFEIPAGGVFEFPDIYEAPLSALDLARVPSYANARLTVPEGFSGSVSMPLVVQSVGWSNNPRVSVITSDGSGTWDANPTVAAWTVDVESPYTVATQPSGVYNSNEPVTLTAVGAAAIYYTGDGSTPTAASAVYAAPVAIAAGGTVKFFGVDPVGNRERVRAYGPTVEQVVLQMSSLAAATVTFTATATGSVGSYEFSFRMYDPRAGWSTVQTYSESDHWVWTRAGAATGRYTVEVWARNRGTTVQLDTFADLAFDVDQDAAPSLTNPGNQTSVESANISLQLAASDPDGDNLTYGATGLPASLTVNPASGLIAGTLSFTSAGSYLVTATVSDGSLSSSQVFTWMVGNTNRAPVLTNPGDQTSSVIASYQQAVVADAPAAYWQLDETTGTTASSSAGTSPGILSGGVTLGQPGALADGSPAMRFNGSTGSVQVASNPALRLAGDLTIELWVNVSLATRQTLISKDYLHEFELTLETDGRLNLYQGNGSTYGGVLSAFGAVASYTWQHVVVTRAAATKTTRFYVNGIAAGSGSYTTAATTSLVAVSIGRTADGTQYVNGRLDEVALYPAVLSPAQISSHWVRRASSADTANYRQAVVADAPAGYWRLDETTGTTATSSAGTSSGTLFGSVTLGQPGALADGSKAMLFDGSTGYVRVASGDALQLAGDLTIEMWVNVSLATRQTLISKDYLHEFELTLETDGRLNLYQGNGSTYGGVLSAFGAVTAHTWQHVVVTRASATKTTRFYINGIAKGSGSYTTAATTSLVAVSIGRTADGTQHVNGRLDEVALYPAVLSPAQIATHYGLRTDAGSGASISLQLSASDPDGDALTYSATALPPGLAVNAKTGLVSGTLAPTSAGAYQVTAAVADGGVSVSRSFTWTITPIDGR